MNLYLLTAMVNVSSDGVHSNLKTSRPGTKPRVSQDKEEGPISFFVV
jgi:hypothetical protein